MEITPWCNGIERRLKSEALSANLFYMLGERTIVCTAIVTLHDGLSDFKVTHSSGDELIDKKVLELLINPTLKPPNPPNNLPYEKKSVLHFYFTQHDSSPFCK